MDEFMSVLWLVGIIVSLYALVVDGVFGRNPAAILIGLVGLVVLGWCAAYWPVAL